MSVISRNPFDLLGDDGDSPAPVKTQPKTETPAAAPARAVPGSTPAGGNNTGSNRGGRYPNRGGRGRGGATSGQQRDDGPRNTAQVSGSGDIEGFETPGGFDGERVNPPKRAHHGPDRHTRTANDQPRISGGHTSSREGGRGGRGRGGSKTPAGGGERRVYERRSGGLPDSQKKVDLGWGANEGTAELTAEVEGEKDAQAEEAAPGTPAPEEETPAADATAAEPAAEAEPEEVQKSFDQFLAERAQSALGDGLGKKEGRTVNTETLEGKAFVREAIDDFFSGKTEKTVKAKAPKKEKVYIEFDGQFATPPGGGAGGRGGRGGDRGSTRGGGRGRGEGRGRGGPRGGAGARGGARSAQPQGINPSDDKAFPSLGA